MCNFQKDPLNNFKWSTRKILKDLEKYKDIQREELLRICINEKLAGTLKRYNEEIDANSDYLLTRSSTRVLKALTKIQKKQDKEILESESEEPPSFEEDEELIVTPTVEDIDIYD